MQNSESMNILHWLNLIFERGTNSKITWIIAIETLVYSTYSLPISTTLQWSTSYWGAWYCEKDGFLWILIEHRNDELTYMMAELQLSADKDQSRCPNTKAGGTPALLALRFFHMGLNEQILVLYTRKNLWDNEE